MARVLLAKRRNEQEAQAAVDALNKEHAGNKFEKYQDGETFGVTVEGKPGETLTIQDVEHMRHTARHAGRMPPRDSKKADPIIGSIGGAGGGGRPVAAVK
jgi:hypothetical protein